jgi:hypothetical protein
MSPADPVPESDFPSRESMLEQQVRILTKALKRTKARVEALGVDDPLDEVLLGITNALALGGCSDLALESPLQDCAPAGGAALYWHDLYQTSVAARMELIDRLGDLLEKHEPDVSVAQWMGWDRV